MATARYATPVVPKPNLGPSASPAASAGSDVGGQSEGGSEAGVGSKGSENEGGSEVAGGSTVGGASAGSDVGGSSEGSVFDGCGSSEGGLEVPREGAIPGHRDSGRGHLRIIGQSCRVTNHLYVDSLLLVASGKMSGSIGLAVIW